MIDSSPRAHFLGAVATTLLSSVALSSAGFAQTSQPAQVAFPLSVETADHAGPIGVGERSLTTDLALIEGLEGHDSITMAGFPMPDGSAATLELERIDVTRRKFGLQVDGEAAPGVIDGLGLTVWEGSVAGDSSSEVMISFSKYGSRGWVRTRASLVHLLASSHDDGSWLGAPGIITTEAALNTFGIQNGSQCGTTPPQNAPTPSAFLPPVANASSGSAESISLRECPIAMETDWQYYQLFNDLNAATAYATTLLSFISNRYEIQASTVLTFPYLQIYTTSNDPWAAPDNGGNSIDMLSEFVAAWQGNIPMNATLGHMMSGASLGGGVAYLDVLCNNQFNFGVSGNIRNIVNFPVVQQPNNWDFVVVAHELGHNFNAPHTHDFCPPLDECPPSQYFGQCQTQQTCSNMGTIMSYCHLCSGGTGNITTYFHPDNADRMRAASAACNDAVFEVLADAPSLLSETSPTMATLQEVTGTLDSATMLYRTSPGAAFTQVSMTEQAGGLWVASLPAVSCGTEVDIYFSFEATGLSTFMAPVDAPASTYEAFVGVEIVTFADNFESNLNWQAVNNGASTGDWQRGVPVNDSGWQYDPVSDFDGSGSCYLTQNELGNTDVDDGSVSLTSPTFDLSDPAAEVSYAYFLNLTNSDGADRLLVEARSAGGSFAEVTRHDISNGLDWTAVTLTQADFNAAGVSPGAAMEMRFTINDDGDQSIVEAGIDAFSVGFVGCGELGTAYCDPAVPNSTGVPAVISVEGSSVVADNDLTLTASSLPVNAFGFFIVSSTQGFIANPGGSTGNLCVLGDIGRYVGPGQIMSSGLGGAFSLAIDLASITQPMGPVGTSPGDTWNFQAWYRDTDPAGATSNFTHGLEVSFQ